LDEIACRYGGVLRRQDLLSAGVTEWQIRRQVQIGAWVRVRRDVYVPATTIERLRGNPARTTALRAAAALGATRSGGVVTHLSAAVIHGLDLLDPPPPGVDLTRPQGSRRVNDIRGVRLRSALIPPQDVTSQYGVPVTTVTRTVVDLARTLDLASALVVADSALRLHPGLDLRECLDRCKGLAGSRTAARVIHHADGRAASALESMGRARFIESALPDPEIGVWIFEAVPKPRQADFLWRCRRVIGESDGLAKYRMDPHRIGEERIRDEQLREAGYEVVHFLWKEPRYSPESVVRRVQRAFDRTRRLGYW
jgi:hypothetical protein